MLMAWGPFRFTVPNYSVETLRRSIKPRLEEQPVIGRAPPIHRLGPGNEEVTLESTFHPHHLNGRGLAQLAGVRQAVNALSPQMLVHINGAGHNIFGLWIATGVDGEETLFDKVGTPQSVKTTLSMKQYDQVAGRSIAMSTIMFDVGFEIGGDAGFDFDFSLRLGF